MNTRLALFFILCISSVFMSFGQSADNFWTDEDNETLVESMLSQMSAEEIVGQVFLVGLPRNVNDTKLLNWIKRRNIGGIKVFGWSGGNLLQMAGRIRGYQKAAATTELQIPLFVATDQEGGWVRHVRGATSQTPGNMAIGAIGNPYESYQTGDYIGREMRVLGINMNFAPTIDIYRNPDAHVIGSRAFNDDPYHTAVLGTAFYKGHEANRVIATAKHFPGHGSAAGDSHGMLPFVNGTLEELESADLYPFRYMINEGVPAVLTGHLSFPDIIDANIPSSLSSYFNIDVLRNRYGFKGVTITDDLYMAGAQKGYSSFSEVCLEALKAGNDMLLFSTTPEYGDPIWRKVFNEYQVNEAFREQIKESVRRILRIKLEYLKNDDRVPLYPDNAEITDFFKDLPAGDFFAQQAYRSVTLLGSEKMPIEGTGLKMLLVGQYRGFINQGKKAFPDADFFQYSASPFYWAKDSEKEIILNKIQNYDTVIFAMANPNSLEILSEMKDYKGTLVVMSLLTPVYFRKVPWVTDKLAIYSWTNESFEAGFAVIKGKLEAHGTLPFSFDRMDEFVETHSDE